MVAGLMRCPSSNIHNLISSVRHEPHVEIAREPRVGSADGTITCVAGGCGLQRFNILGMRQLC